MQQPLTAAVLLIGNEILTGSIEEANLKYIAVALGKRGIAIRETRIVLDIEIEIVNALNALRTRYDYVFTTGGIGPTHDDITLQAVAEAFAVKNVKQEKIFDLIERKMQKNNIEFNPTAQRMAFAPEGAEMIETTHSVIPAYKMDNVFILAGVPRIMRIMLDSILPTLKSGSPLLKKRVMANISESTIAQALQTIQSRYADVDIGSYPQDTKAGAQYKVVFIVSGCSEQILDVVCREILDACLQLGYEAVLEAK